MPMRSVSVSVERHLLIDVGNSRVKWAWCTDPARPLEAEGSIVHAANREQWLDQLAGGGGGAANSILVSDVAGLDQPEIRRLQALYQCQPGFVQVQADCLNLVVAYPNPGNLGVDRWLAMLAAWQPQPRPLVLIDAGSALTVDLITAQGRHLGGWIAPGLRGLAEGLAQGAPGLPATPGFSEDAAPANDTQPAILNARSALVAGLVQQAMEHLVQESGRPATDIEQVITGGDGAQVAKLLRHHDRMTLRPHLVLDGLRILLLQNRNTPK